VNPRRFCAGTSDGQVSASFHLCSIFTHSSVTDAIYS